MADGSQATLPLYSAAGRGVGGVNSAVTGISQAVLQTPAAVSKDGGVNTSTATLQTITAAGVGSSQPAIGPALIVAAGAGTTGVVGTSAAALERVAALGNVYPVGLSAAFLEPVSAASLGYAGASGTSVVVLEEVAPAALGGGVASGNSAVAVPAWIAAGAGFLGTGASFSAVVMHTESQALWTYTNFAFNSFARFKGNVLAAGDAGLFTLGGADDAGTKISAQATFGITDFNTAHEKRIDRVYLGYRSSGEMILRVTVDETKTRDYLVPAMIPANGGLHGRHVKLGRGVEARYYQFSILNRNGSDFSLNILECKPTVLRRRVGGIDA